MVSDEQRERAVDELRRHVGAGRLDLDHFAERVGAVWSANTLAELDAALAGLPRMAIADPSRRPPLLAAEQGAPGGGSAGGAMGPAAARLVLLVSALLAVAAIVFVVLAQWVWAVLIVVAWCAGAVQGRLAGRARGR